MLIDIIGYGIVIFLMIILLYRDFKHHWCLGRTCITRDTIMNSESNINEKMSHLLESQSQLAVWGFSFVIAAISAFVIGILIYRKLPPFQQFLPIFIVIFLVAYFEESYRMFHFTSKVDKGVIVSLRKGI